MPNALPRLPLFVATLAAVLAILMLAAMPADSAEQRRAVVNRDADYYGGDYRTEQNVTLDQCQAACIADAACKAFTFNGKGMCFLKSAAGELKTFRGATAGKIIEPVAAAAPAAPPEADLGDAPSLAFMPGYVADEAGQLADTLANAAPAGGDAAALAAQAASQLNMGDVRGAAQSWRTALGASQEDPALWIGLARSVLAIPPADGNEQYMLPRDATSAALIGYGLTRTASQRAEALALLAQGLERRELYRPALESYKASLALADSAPVRQTFLDLKSRKGFRVVENSVDADTAAPRACVQFSDALVLSGVDYQSYVTLNGQPAPAVRAEGTQLCVDGLQHGSRYQIGLRQGLPAAIGEVLEAPVTLDVYVRDRAPSVRFTGNNFVLPKAGAKGIPLVTVNAREADLTLYRIGDRSLSRVIAEGRFMRQMDGYEAGMIPDTLGEEVWKGVIETAYDLNKEVLTLFPVDEALAARRPGVYVLVATARGERREEWSPKATQWFVVSGIGLATFTGNDGLTVYARDLETAQPLAGVSLDLIARNNEVLAKATTDASGIARFDAGLARGPGSLAPAALTASGAGGDFVFLDLTRPGFDLSDRGVTGRAAPGPVDVFLYTERGIYRPGETVNAQALARDDAARAVEGLPLTVVFRRPDGLEAQRVQSDDKGLGGHWTTLALPRNAMRGTWTVAVFTDPKANPVAQQSFLVEDFIPDRVEFDLALSPAVIAPDAPATATIDGRFLYGAPASDLSVEGELRIASTRTLKGFDGFVFGLADEDAVNVNQPLEDLPATDEQGKASFEVVLDELPFATRPLAATLIARLREGSGRAVERTATAPIAADQPYIGLKPSFTGDTVAMGTAASFDVVAAVPDGVRPLPSGLAWSLERIERQYQWYRQNGNWNYEPIVSTKRVADGVVSAPAGSPPGAPGRIALNPLDWGRYRLTVIAAGENGPRTSIEFTSGWYVDQASTETPDGLEVALDKAKYAAGDTAKLTISPQFAGQAQVIVGADRILWQTNVSVPKEGATVEIPVSADYGAGAYVTVALYRPGANADTRMPQRAIGLRWLTVDPGARALPVAFDVPEKHEPRSRLEIPVTVTTATAGETAYVAVAAVDVGILTLTRYTPPDPAAWYFGQRRLGLSISDLYGNLIDGTQGAVGRIRNGGDQAGMGMEGSPPTEKLVAFFSGPVKLDATGKASVAFDLPEFNGTVRLMAVAWTKDGVGSASRDVVVRDPIVVTATAPKAMAPGDRSTLRLDIASTDAPAGDYQLTVDAPAQITLDAARVPASVALEPGKRTAVAIPVTAGEPGEGAVVVRLSRMEGPAVERTQIVKVRPAQLPLTERTVVAIPPAGSVSIDAELLAGRLTPGAEVTVGISRSAGFDVPSLLLSLDRYPYGCAEQTVSRALPLLYLSEVARDAGMDSGEDVRQRVQDAIDRVLAFQGAGGSFGLWSPGSGDVWLDSFVTDFLTRAREARYEVPEEAFSLALDNLKNALAYDVNLTDQGAQTAYALYVLARNKRASVGDLRYFADARLAEFPTATARAQIAAALALYGDAQRAQAAFDQAFALVRSSPPSWSRTDYGSALRDGAALVALAGETKPPVKGLADMAATVGAMAQKARATSTQEQAWLLLAAHALKAGGEAITLDVNGTPHAGRFATRIGAAALAASPVVAVNTGSEPVEAVITTRGAPEAPMPAQASGFAIERTYWTLAGEQADPATVAQNDRFLVVIKVTQADAWAARVLVQDLLPGGFEIENPRLVASADLAAFDWLPEVTAAHTEARADRFVAAFDRRADDEREFTFAYLVRAVSPGTYALPPAVVEDMYRPHLSARTGMGQVEVIGPAP